MRIEVDRLGFPLLRLADPRVAIGLWPVTKVQFEVLIAEPNDWNDDWYREVLEVNPRATWRGEAPRQTERWFMTGVWPDEAAAFLRWLGGGFSLPTASLWQQIYETARQVTLNANSIRELTGPFFDDPRSHEAARSMLGSFIAARPSCSLSQLTLLDKGVFEWVRVGHEEYGGLGSPRSEFIKHLFNPLLDAPLRPVGSGRPRCFGFRLVRERDDS